MTSIGPATGFAATGSPEASASSTRRGQGVGQTWEHEDVRTRVGGGKPLFAHFADEIRSRKAFLKLLPSRSVPNDDL